MQQMTSDTAQRIVKKLPVNPGPAAWYEILGQTPNYPEAEGNITADWLIIGGGFTGLSAAKRLSQLRGSDKIVLLEAHQIGTGPAGRNSGFMIDLPHELGDDGYAGAIDADLKQIHLNRHAQQFAKDCAEEYGMADETVRAVGRVNGAIDANGKKHNDAYAAHLDRLGESYQHMSAGDMKDMTGTEFYASGLFLPGAVMLQPALYVSLLARGLTTQETHPVSLHEHSPAISFERRGKSWHVNTPKARITAKYVIMAVNGHAENFGFYENRLMHVFTYASMTEALTEDQQARLGGELSWGITPSDPMGSTVRRHDGHGGNRIVVRNRWTYDPSMEVSEARVKAFGRDQDLSFIRRFPQLDDVKMAYRWSGHLCLSRNSAPAFGELEENWFSACCQNGLGTAKGTLAGIGAVDLAIQANSPIVTELLSYEAPPKLPPKAITKIGANLILKWREFKGRAER